MHRQLTVAEIEAIIVRVTRNHDLYVMVFDARGVMPAVLADEIGIRH